MYRNIFRVVNIQILQKRFYSENEVRVRFAPSPTGLLHIGGLRTALYNYLFARANNGSFILRIEDTDQCRLVPGATEKLQNDLLWAGIIPDEDPTRGGPVGPYCQSKRLEMYRDHVFKLLDNKSAYYCFCTENRLDLIRRESLKLGQVPKYDNRCRHLSTDEINTKLKRGQPHCIRFKLSEEPEPFNDIIYGHILHDIVQHEGDPVIIKTDGFPTYHFANVVDDHLMKISHVLRGVEWQISTPKHLMLYKAFGWTPPKFGHLPLILSSDGSKLSKRTKDISIESFRQDGIFPLALLNYATYAGSGFDKEQTEYIDSFQELIKKFDITKIKTSSGKLSPEKLLEFNKLELNKLLMNEKNHKFLVERVKKIITDAYLVDVDASELDDDHILQILKWARHRICKLNDLASPNMIFLWTSPKTLPDISQPEYLDAIKKLCTTLAELDVTNFTKEWISVYLKDFAKNNQIKYSIFMKNLRLGLTDVKDGPPVAEMMELLGKDRTVSRLKRCIS